MQKLYSLAHRYNRWFDRSREMHRFLAFILPMVIGTLSYVIGLHLHFGPAVSAGILVFAVFSFISVVRANKQGGVHRESGYVITGLLAFMCVTALVLN